MKKFKLRKDVSKTWNGMTLYRVEALVDIPWHDVKAGDLGGWVENENNLADDAWVFGEAIVCGKARVSGEAVVCEKARVGEKARVSGKALISGNAIVYGRAQVSGRAQVAGNAEIYGKAEVLGQAEVIGDKIEEQKELTFIRAEDFYDITITPNFMKIGCQFHTRKAWWGFTDKEIEKMDGEKALKFWRKYKPILMAICEEKREGY